MSGQTKDVLIVTGTCGVGKTTIAKAWARERGGVVIECDNLTDSLDKEDFPKWSKKEEKLVASLAVNMAYEYLDKGLPVAIDYVFTPEAIDNIRMELFRMSNLNVKSIRLTCDLEENQKRDAQRMPQDQMGERVKTVGDELNSQNWAGYVQEIDTTKLSIDEVLKAIV